MNFLMISAPKDLGPFLSSGLYRGFDLATLALHQPDLHCVVIDNSEPMARCSLWWNTAPRYEAEKIGFIGHYESLDDKAAEEILEQACQHLAKQGCTLAVGPIDGTTWRNYRFVSENPFNAPPFLLEPTHPPEYPEQWLQEGFTPLAHYTSTLQSSLEADPEVTRRLDKLINTRLAKAGITFRSLDVSKVERELETIFDISLKSFADNLLYSPISEEEFMGSYQKILPFALPDLVLFAELNGEAIGYVFGIPDVLQKQRGETPETFIIKTLAVLPEHTNKGLGTVLVDFVIRKAKDLGFNKAIHALMLETNQSQTISERFSSQMLRRYTLYSKRLA
jgi:GNAT superfamily N-acetyltransferase